jgi:hypothetical protein
MQCMRSQLGRHTFSTDPQERSLRFPFRQYITLKEPCCSSTMFCLPKSVVIRRRVRGRKPALDVPSQLVTYKIPSVSETKGRETRTFHFVCFIYHLVNSDCELELVWVILILFYPRHVPKYNRIVSIDILPPNGTDTRKNLRTIMQALRTFHYCPHISHKAMDHTQERYDSHPSLVLGQSTQRPENGLYVALIQ